METEEEKRKLKTAPNGESSKAGHGFKNEVEVGEMCVVPMFSRKRAFGDWICDANCRLRKFDPWPMSELLDKMISMLKKPPIPKDREARFLIGGELDRQKRESYMLGIHGSTDYVVIGKKWMLDLFKLRYRQS